MIKKKDIVLSHWGIILTAIFHLQLYELSFSMVYSIFFTQILYIYEIQINTSIYNTATNDYLISYWITFNGSSYTSNEFQVSESYAGNKSKNVALEK